MPVIKSAIKKLRRDRKVTRANDLSRASLNHALKTANKQKTAKALSAAVSLVDRAVKKNLMHKNRAARIKSALSKLARLGSTASRRVKPVSKSVAKASKPKTTHPRKSAPRSALAPSARSERSRTEAEG